MIKTHSYDKTHSIHHTYTLSLMAYGLLGYKEKPLT